MSAFIQFILLILISINVFVYCGKPLLFAEDNLKSSHGNIIFSSVIFRHGDRAPFTFYPNDPYGNKSHWEIHWPQGKGQLSKLGKLQEYNLGIPGWQTKANLTVRLCNLIVSLTTDCRNGTNVAAVPIADLTAVIISEIV